MLVITKNHPAFRGIYWATTARSGDGLRGLNNIKVEIHGDKFKFIGCDGHRLHIFKTTESVGISGGVYSIEKRTKSKIIFNNVIDGTYPNYKLVIPGPCDVDKSSKFVTLVKIEENFKNMVHALPSNVCLNYTYFSDLISFDKRECRVMITKPMTSDPDNIKILIKKEEYFGIVMPIRVTERMEWKDNDK